MKLRGTVAGRRKGSKRFPLESKLQLELEFKLQLVRLQAEAVGVWEMERVVPQQGTS